MRVLEEMLWILRMSLDGSLELWWVALVLIALVALALGSLVRHGTGPHPAVTVLLVSAPLWALLFAWMAVHFAADRSSATAVEDARTPATALGLLGTAALLQAIVCVAVSRNQRLVASAVAASATWFVFWVFFVAVMSISGVWL